MVNNSRPTMRKGHSLRTFEAFGNRSYRLLWPANFLAYICRWMQLTLLGWLVLELTDSPFSVALVGFFGMLPLLILGMVGGVLADRVNKHRILIMTQVISCAAAFATVLLLKTGSDTFLARLRCDGVHRHRVGIGYAFPTFSHTRPRRQGRRDQRYSNGFCRYAGEPYDRSGVGGCTDNHG